MHAAPTSVTQSSRFVQGGETLRAYGCRHQPRGDPACRNSYANSASTASCCWSWPACSRPSWDSCWPCH